MLTDTDRALLRDELGDTPDDATLEDWHDELGHWLPVAIRALKRRYATAAAGAPASLSLDGVLSVSLGKADLAALRAQITDLETRWATLQGIPGPGTVSTARITRPDRPR